MTNEASRQGCCLSSFRASSTASKSWSTSAGHRLHNLPYFPQLHTHSSGLASGSWAGKSSTTTLWMLRQPGTHYLGLAVDVVAVPNHRPLAGHLVGQVLQELHHL